jgi:two-component system sensor histidine kinase CreC
MYIAAPVMDKGRIIGVLSVGKPNLAMTPVIKRSERRILWAGGALLGIALLIGAASSGGSISLSASWCAMRTR